MNLYKIKNWIALYENNRTRDLKEMTWFPIPNRFDGDGYTELVEGHPNGAAHYGIWIAILGVASRCDPRGTLLRDGAVPHNSTSLARKTRLPKVMFDEALPRLIEVGWITSEQIVNHCQQTIPQEGAGKPQEGAAIPHPSDYGMEGNGREWNTPSSPSAMVSEPVKRRKVSATPSQIESIYHGYPRKVGKLEACKAIAKAIDRVNAEGRDALEYLLDRVTAYAKACKGKDQRYIPHPATWFNQGRYDDDPGAWAEAQDPEEEGDDGEFHPIRDPDVIRQILIDNP